MCRPLFIAFAFCLQGVATLGQTAPAFFSGSFDTLTARIPLGFAGHDILALCRAPDEADPPRGAFETTDAYLARLAIPPADQRLLAFVGVLAGFTSIKDEEMLGLHPEPDYGERDGRKQMVITYDPDSQQLSMWPYDLSVIGRGLAESQPYLMLRSIMVSSNSSVMQNAFGAKVNVIRRHTRDYGISPTNPRLQSLVENPPLGSYRIDAALAERLMRQADRTLTLCRIERHPSMPIMLRGEDGKEATFDSPSSAYIESEAISVRIESVWLYQSRTGEVLAKLRPEDEARPALGDVTVPTLLSIVGAEVPTATLRWAGLDFRVKAGEAVKGFFVERVTNDRVILVNLGVSGERARITIVLDHAGSQGRLERDPADNR